MPLVTTKLMHNVVLKDMKMIVRLNDQWHKTFKNWKMSIKKTERFLTSAIDNIIWITKCV